VVAVLSTFGTASSEAALRWKGVDWLDFLGAELYLNQSGYLEVRPYDTNSANPYAAQHTTSNAFRSASTPWVEVTFLDDPAKKSTVELWMTDRVNAWTQIGALDGYENYIIHWWNISNGTRGMIDTAIRRSYGQHKMKVAMQKDGKLDYWFNDTLIWTASTEKMKAQYFGDVYLATQYSVATFIDYQAGTDYNPPASLISIELDIKPGGNPNNINLSSQGVVPVAVLTTPSFDARDVDPKTLFFAEAAPTRCTRADVENDGDLDLLCHFQTQDLHLNLDAATATLTGATYHGEKIEGEDSIRIVPGSQKVKKKGK
jgi:hypothetical protein